MNVSATVNPLQVGICVTSDVQSAIAITVVQAGKVRILRHWYNFCIQSCDPHEQALQPAIQCQRPAMQATSLNTA